MKSFFFFLSASFMGGGIIFHLTKDLYLALGILVFVGAVLLFIDAQFEDLAKKLKE